MTPIIVEKLRAGEKLSDLCAKYFLTANRHHAFDHLVGLHYSQIESPMADPLVQQCRGLILDERDNWNVVAWPFDRFFNDGEQIAAKIDWCTASVQEKLDGSLMIVYFYGGKWNVGTSGMPDAYGNVNGFNHTFASLFWDTAQQYNLREALEGAPRITYMFELTAPENKQVVIHRERKLTLLGARDPATGQEYRPEQARSRLLDATPIARTFPLRNLGDVVKSFDSFKPLDQEGYVVCDAAFNRIKVKHPGYVALHHMKSSSSPRALVEIARSGEVDEVAAAFPEWSDVLFKIRERLNLLVAELCRDFDRAYMWAGKNPNSYRKTFAVGATRSRLPGALFAVLDKKTPSVRQYLKDMQIDNLISVLNHDGRMFSCLSSAPSQQ